MQLLGEQESHHHMILQNLQIPLQSTPCYQGVPSPTHSCCFPTHPPLLAIQSISSQDTPLRQSLTKGHKHVCQMGLRPGGLEKEPNLRLVSTRIKKQFKKMSKSNKKIIKCLKGIAQQIERSLLAPIISPPQSVSCNPLQTQQTAFQHANPNYSIKASPSWIPDKFAVTQSSLSTLLIPMTADNDGSSDEENVELGSRYLYQELLCRVERERKWRKWHRNNDKENMMAAGNISKQQVVMVTSVNNRL